MPNLYSSDQIIRTLLREGFWKVSQKGSHAKFRKKNGSKLTVIVPVGKKEIPYGTFKSILRQSSLEEESFRD